MFTTYNFNTNMFIPRSRTNILFIKKEIKMKSELKDDCFRIINKSNFIPEIVDEIDPMKDIIISIPGRKFFLKRTINGTLNFITVKDIMLDSTISFSKNISRTDVFEKLCISTPLGIKTIFTEPLKVPYYFKTKTFYETEKVIVDEKLNSLILHKFMISMYLDLFKLRECENVIKIPKNTPVLEISFLPHYFIGNPEVKKIRRTYLIESEEICENFINTFG